MGTNTLQSQSGGVGADHGTASNLAASDRELGSDSKSLMGQRGSFASSGSRFSDSKDVAPAKAVRSYANVLRTKPSAQITAPRQYPLPAGNAKEPTVFEQIEALKASLQKNGRRNGRKA